MSRLDRYQNPELYDQLAAEYVLGTLKGRARQRFVRLMDERPYIQAAVVEWQGRLDPLGERSPEVRPPSRVWRSIEREIRARDRAAQRAQAESRAKPSFWQSVAFYHVNRDLLRNFYCEIDKWYMQSLTAQMNELFQGSQGQGIRQVDYRRLFVIPAATKAPRSFSGKGI